MMARRRNRRRIIRRRRRMRIPRSILNGARIRGRQHPFTNSASPWINYTVTFKWTPAEVGIGCVTIQNIKAQINSELGLDATKIIARIYRFDAWVLPVSINTNRNCVVVAPHDFTQGQDCSRKTYLNWYEAWGTNTQPAHVHYLWPRSMQMYALDSASSASIISFDIVDKNLSYLVKFHVAWRPEMADPNPRQGIITSARSACLPGYDPPPDPDGFEDLGNSVSPLTAVVSQLHT